MTVKPRKSPRSNLPYVLIALSLVEAFGAYKLYELNSLITGFTSLLIAYTALSTFIVATCQLFGYIRVFGKTEDGSIDLFQRLISAPYTYFYRFVVYAHRFLIRHEPVATRIAPGFYLSGWFDSASHARDAFIEFEKHNGPTAKPKDSRVAVLDLTCELPRMVYDPKVIAEYMCIPTFDRCAPNVADLERCTRWVLEHRKAGREVVIHCAFGHGRSATCLVAAMLLSGVASSIVQAEEVLRRVRPLVELTTIQVHALNQWLAHFHPEFVTTQKY